MLDIGEGPGHDLPEFGGVAHHGQMGQLMYNDVFDEVGGEHHIAPAETEGPVRGAAAPLAALSPDHDPILLPEAHAGPPLVDKRGDVVLGPGAIPGLEGLTEGVAARFVVESRGHGDLKGLGVQFDPGPGDLGRSHHQGVATTQIGQGVAGDEGQGLAAVR